MQESKSLVEIEPRLNLKLDKSADVVQLDDDVSSLMERPQEDLSSGLTPLQRRTFKDWDEWRDDQR